MSSWPLESRATRAARWSTLEIVALVLIGAGIVALAFGGIPYTRAARLGLELPHQVRAPVRLPAGVGAGLGAVVLGGAMLLSRRIQYRIQDAPGADVRLRWPR